VSEPGTPLPDPYLARATDPPRTSGNAIASVVLSLLGFVCLPAIGGLLGVTLGVAAKSEIDHSSGRLTGKAMATTGIALGALNLIVTVLGVAGLIGWLDTLDASSASTAAPIAPASPPLLAPAPPPKPPAAATRAGAKPGSASREGGVVVTRVGRITLVDVGRDVDSLRSELERQSIAARKDGQKLLLWLVTPDCRPCNGVAASLPDAEMQEALAGLRVVRLDVRDFGVELSFLGAPTQKIPGFVLVSPNLRAADYVHGGEWDDDIAKNIAPVLGKFVRGTYTARREPWRGGARDDETAL
jgi:hypothetical protein